MNKQAASGKSGLFRALWSVTRPSRKGSPGKAIAAAGPVLSVPPLVSLLEFDVQEREFLLTLARASVRNASAGLEPLTHTPVRARLAEKRGCFVTLARRGILRGCVGNVLPLRPLHEAVAENARAAATRDPRFPPVEPSELEELNIEISILTEPVRLSFATADDLLRQLKPGVSGVLLEIEGRLATFLPQVWHQIPNPLDFLNRLAEKAGFPPEAWREPGVTISVYRTQCFQEPGPQACCQPFPDL